MHLLGPVGKKYRTVYVLGKRHSEVRGTRWLDMYVGLNGSKLVNEVARMEPIELASDPLASTPSDG